MIVNYGEFYFTKDDGYLAVSHAPDPDGKELTHVTYVEPGDSLADVVGKVWRHVNATPGEVEKVGGTSGTPLD